MPIIIQYLVRDFGVPLYLLFLDSETILTDLQATRPSHSDCKSNLNKIIKKRIFLLLF